MAMERSLRSYGRPVLYLLSRIDTNMKCNTGMYCFATQASEKSTRLEERTTENTDGVDFRVFEIKGLKPAEKRKARKIQKAEVPPDRSQRLRPDHDWTAVWPARATFKSSVVPFPVRQGFVKNTDENKGVSPAAYANAELMKIPNFLHLTPAHIKAHCQELKKFCTAWPSGLETDEKCEAHFPLEVISSSYLSAGPSIRNPKARGVTCKLKLSKLELDYHARDKLIRLVGDKYNPMTQEIRLSSDRCPMVKQNKDFVMYLLTALYYESQKVEPWEEEKTAADMEKYFWDISKSKTSVVRLLTRIHQVNQNQTDSSGSPVADEVPSPEDLLKTDSVQDYKAATCDLINSGEDQANIDHYKQAVLKLLNLRT